MFKGTGTAIITPFDEELNVDYSSLKKFIHFQVDNNVNAIVVLGTTGESPTIDEEERRKIIDSVVTEVNGRIPVVVGTGTNDAKKTVKYNKIAEEYKADGLLIVNPYYNKGTQSSLVDYFKYIAGQTSLPIILYNVPSRTSMNVLPDTILKIHYAAPNVVAVKEACADISQISSLCMRKPDSLAVLSGNDDQTLPIMALGGVGVISVFSNVFPKEMSELTEALLNKDYDKGRKLNKKYLKMMDLLFIETNPMPVKAAVTILNYCKNTLRLPLKPVTETSYNLIKAEMERLLIQ